MATNSESATDVDEAREHKLRENVLVSPTLLSMWGKKKRRVPFQLAYAPESVQVWQKACNHLASIWRLNQSKKLRRHEVFETNQNYHPQEANTADPFQRTIYDQVIYHAGRWMDVLHSGMRKRYTMKHEKKPLDADTEQNNVNRRIVRMWRNEQHSIFNKFSCETTMATFRYMFDFMQKGVYVRIVNGKLETYLPFCKRYFSNRYYTQLVMSKNNAPMKEDARALRALKAAEDHLRQFERYENGSASHRGYAKALRHFLKAEDKAARLFCQTVDPSPAATPTAARHCHGNKRMNRRHWVANGGFFRSDAYFGDKDVLHYLLLLQNTLTRQDVQDVTVDFFLNLRDHPVMRVKKKTKGRVTEPLLPPYEDLYTESTEKKMQEELQEVQAKRYSAVLSPCGRKGKMSYADLPMPTTDDIEYHTQTLLVDGGQDSAEVPAHQADSMDAASFEMAWEDRIPAVQFRGAATGAGVKEDTNMRIAAWCQYVNLHASRGACARPSLIDAKLVSLNRKLKLHRTRKTMDCIDEGSCCNGDTVCHIESGARMSKTELAKYRYALCLDGHTRAFRMATEFMFGSLVIVPNSGNYLWFEPWLRPAKLVRDSDGAITIKTAKDSTESARQCTHIEIDGTHTESTRGGKSQQQCTIGDLLDIVLFLRSNNATCLRIAQQGVQFHRKYLSRESSFMYDYMGCMLRNMANRNADKDRMFPTHGSGKKKVAKKVVGIIVGYRNRDTDDETTPRQKQLAEFCEYFKDHWDRGKVDYQIIVVKQPFPSEKDIDEVVAWLKSGLEPARGSDEEAHEVPKPVRRFCAAKNLENQRNFIKYIRREVFQNSDRGVALRDLAGQICELPFNLGQLKNEGMRQFLAHVKKQKQKQSHVIFTDIDILPDQELLSFYYKKPPKRCVAALAQRGTVYEPVSLCEMPYTRWRAHVPQRNEKQSYASVMPNDDEARLKDFSDKWASLYPCPFMGSCFSCSVRTFIAFGGFPDQMWGWGGEDDAIQIHIMTVNKNNKNKKQNIGYVVPSRGRVIDLETGPTTEPLKRGGGRNKNKVREDRKWEKLASISTPPIFNTRSASVCTNADLDNNLNKFSMTMTMNDPCNLSAYMNAEQVNVKRNEQHSDIRNYSETILWNCREHAQVQQQAGGGCATGVFSEDEQEQEPQPVEIVQNEASESDVNESTVQDTRNAAGGNAMTSDALSDDSLANDALHNTGGFATSVGTDIRTEDSSEDRKDPYDGGAPRKHTQKRHSVPPLRRTMRANQSHSKHELRDILQDGTLDVLLR